MKKVQLELSLVIDPSTIIKQKLQVNTLLLIPTLFEQKYFDKKQLRYLEFKEETHFRGMQIINTDLIYEGP